MENVQFQKVPVWTDPILDLISVRLSDAAHRNINENVSFFFKTLVFDRLFLEKTSKFALL